MIGVTLGELMIVCVALGVCFVSVWWLVAVSRVREAESRKHQGVITCRICGVRYETTSGDLSTCPACGTPNELQPPGGI